MPFDYFHIARFFYEEYPLAISICVVFTFWAGLAALSRLFRIIIDNLLTVWANSPPSNQVVIEAGNVRIEFGCSVEPVPWEFVREFAVSHRDAVERGFAPLFQREWWWGGNKTGRVCYAGMRVVEEGGVAVPPY